MYREGGRFHPLQEELLEFLLEKSKKNFIATLALSMLSFEEVGNLGEFEKFVESLDSSRIKVFVWRWPSSFW
jgi:hypothetical protein